ncbi:MAG: HAD hydrolase-like protein, partial [Actinobacteria bacterium]|nr:HAD hydrolase-like protein [Actinomycetota bacterium]
SILERLRRCDIAVDEEHLVTAAEVVAQQVCAGDRVLSVAGPGVTEALEAKGAQVVSEGPCEFVIVGWTDEISYELIAHASRAIRSGARFLATNLDPTHPTPEGLSPGSGAFVAAVAVAAEQEATLCGKPSRQMISYLRDNYGEAGLVVGDRLSTDGELAAGLGVPFLFVDGGTETGLGHEYHHRGATFEEVVEGWRQSRG